MANNDLVGSVVKAIALVKIIASAPDGLKMSELAEAANLKTMTCFNLVRTLIAGGFLEKINGRLYVGNEISRLARNRFQSEFFHQAEKALQTLNRRRPRATAIFAVPGEAGMEQTHRISFDHPGVIQRLNNEPMPPYVSAAGLLGLAFLPEGEVRIRIEEKYPFAEFGIPLWKSRKKLDSYLEQCRREQIAVVPFDTDVFRRISVPLFDKSGNFIAVLGASCPARDFSEAELLSVRKDLEELSQTFKNGKY